MSQPKESPLVDYSCLFDKHAGGIFTNAPMMATNASPNSHPPLSFTLADLDAVHKKLDALGPIDSHAWVNQATWDALRAYFKANPKESAYPDFTCLTIQVDAETPNGIMELGIYDRDCASGMMTKVVRRRIVLR